MRAETLSHSEAYAATADGAVPARSMTHIGQQELQRAFKKSERLRIHDLGLAEALVR